MAISSAWTSRYVNRGLTPAGLINEEDDPSMVDVPDRGVCYRNAVFQVLLNTPIIVNWLDSHLRDDCNIRDCLICSLGNASARYWNVNPDFKDLGTQTTEFWHLCQKLFWGARAQMKKGIGPHDSQKGWAPASFFTHLLNTIQEQARREPSLFQTVQRLFTGTVATRYLCINPRCRRQSPEFEWQEFNHVALRAHDPIRRSKTGVKEGIMRSFRAWEGGDYNHTGQMLRTCNACKHTALPYHQFVDLPEVLVVHVDHELINRERNRPLPDDVPWEENINLTSLVQGKRKTEYRLAGCIAMETVEEHAIAFVRSPDNRWYKWDDEDVVGGIETWTDYDNLQRAPLTGDQRRTIPDVFLYIRSDDQGKSRSSRKDFVGHVSGNYVYEAESPPTAGSISLGFLEGVGAATFAGRFFVRPSEPEQALDTENVDLHSSVAYMLRGRTWAGRAQQRLTLRQKSRHEQKQDPGHETEDSDGSITDMIESTRSGQGH